MASGQVQYFPNRTCNGDPDIYGNGKCDSHHYRKREPHGDGDNLGNANRDGYSYRNSYPDKYNNPYPDSYCNSYTDKYDNPDPDCHRDADTNGNLQYDRGQGQLVAWWRRCRLRIDLAANLPDKRAGRGRHLRQQPDVLFCSGCCK